jgi:hypothetical protein
MISNNKIAIKTEAEITNSSEKEKYASLGKEMVRFEGTLYNPDNNVKLFYDFF